MPFDWSPLWLSVRYAGLATLFAIVLGLPLAWLLAHRRFPGSGLLDAAATLPIVLPPAVLVYYLLVALGRWRAAFSWRTALVLSTVYTLPLLIAIFRAGLEGVDPSFENAARGLGASEWRVFWRISVPLAWRTLLAAILAGFARAFADFGLTAIIDGPERSGWTTLLIAGIAAVSLAALYAGSRLRFSRVLA
ncbi:MAG: ABC transporter permease subunit [Bryobacteraceae bacterium]